MGRIERRSLGDYGMPRRGAFGAHFWEGIVWGIGLMATTMLVLVLLGVSHIGDLAVSGGASLKYGLAWGIAFILVGVAEEFAFRGYTLFTLTTSVGFWPAALILSGGFAIAHLPAGETWLGVLQDFLAGMMFALPLRRTGALWFSIGLHAGWDWMQTFFFGVSIGGMRPHGYLLNTSFSGSAWLSGGRLGPGNSVIPIGVFGLALILLHFRLPEARYPRPEALKGPSSVSQAASGSGSAISSFPAR
jgi:membrane protease YdiL (CAAX protease family)